MKTGARLGSDSGNGKQVQQGQVPGLPTRNSQVKDKEGGEGEEVASDDKVGMKVTQGTVGMAQAKIVDDVSSLESDTPHSSDDEDFLDLLVDTLDGEFDPELLI